MKTPTASRAALGLGLAALFVPASPAPRYDIIIRHGLIVDGTGAPRMAGDIAISGGRIARIGNLAGATATTEIDATGLMVTPGFINTHSHATPSALATAENMLTQGVTTELLNADGGGPIDLTTQLDPIGQNGPALNVAASIGFNAVWQSVMGLSNKRPTDDDIAKMRALIVKGLEAGAFGVSAGLDYKPAYFATTDEVVRIVEAAGKWRTFFPNHDRAGAESGYSSRAGMEETRAIGERAGLVPEFTHMKVQGREQGTAAKVVAMMDSSSAAGRWIATDIYPYLAGQTALSALIIPGWAQDGGTEAMRARFRDSTLRARIIKESDEAISARFNGPDRIMVLGTRRLSDIMTETGSPSAGAAVVKVLETESPWAILGFGIEPDLVRLMQYRSASIACDCGATVGSRGHPRYYGTFPRVLGRYIREQHIMSWEEAIRKMSGQPAAMMGLVDRGILAPGMAADITVFDTATVIDHATFEKPDAWSEGIRHVIVNGHVALRDGKATGDKGGQVLRRAGASPSRPMDLAAARRVSAAGTIPGPDGKPVRVSVALSQPRGSRRATGTVTIGGARASALGTLQAAAGWAAITGRTLVDGVDRAFTLVLDAADPLADGTPPTVRFAVEGRPALEGRLAGSLTLLPKAPAPRPR